MPQVLQKSPHGRFAALDLETEHATESLLLSAGDIVAAVTAKTRIIHTANSGMLVKDCRQVQRIFLMLAQSRVERAKTT